METQTETIKPVLTSEQHYAGFLTRVVAIIIDTIIVVCIGAAVGFILSGGKETSVQGIPALLIPYAYHMILLTYNEGATIGKKIMKIKVVKIDGSKMDLGTAFLRTLSYCLSAIPLLLGFIWVAFDSKKQGFHDKIVKTYVVKA